MTKGKIKKAVSKKEDAPNFDSFEYHERFRLMDWEDSYLDAMAVAMRDWVDDPKNDAVKLAEFAHKYRVNYDTIIDHSEHHKALADAVLYAKGVLGTKREKMALIGKWNANLVQATMGIYDRDFRRNHEWKAKLAQKDTAQGNITVVMQPFPESDKVPVKKEKK